MFLVVFAFVLVLFLLERLGSLVVRVLDAR